MRAIVDLVDDGPDAVKTSGNLVPFAAICDEASRRPRRPLSDVRLVGRRQARSRNARVGFSDPHRGARRPAEEKSNTWVLSVSVSSAKEIKTGLLCDDTVDK